MSVLTQRAVTLYPESLRDQINNSVIGTGYDSLLRQLVFRNENCNRVSKGKSTDSSRGTPEPSTSAEGPGTNRKTRKRDAYGCINFQPELKSDESKTIEEEKQYLKDSYTNPDPEKWDTKRIARAIKICFPQQRKMINEEAPVIEIQREWPCLFEFNGMMLHFELLVGLNLQNVLKESCEGAKLKATLSFLKGTGKHGALLAEVKHHEQEQNSKKFELPAMLLGLLDHFGENRQCLFCSVDVTNLLFIPQVLCFDIYFKWFLLNFKQT